MTNAFLVNLDRCIGCYACEIACKDENDLASEIRRVNIIKVDVSKFNRFYIPVFEIDRRGVGGCTLCPQLTSENRMPACVNNCLTNALYFGKSEEIEAKAKNMAKARYDKLYRKTMVAYISSKQFGNKFKEALKNKKPEK